MKPAAIMFATLVALAPSTLSFASEGVTPAAERSAFALPAVGDWMPEEVVAISATSGSSSSSSEFPQAASWVAGTKLESIRYRPRRRYRERDDENYDSGRRSGGYSQLHGGFFDPDGDPSRGVLFGFRAGTNLEDKIQLGLGLDWSHRSDRQSAVVREVPIPGGGTAEQRQELARSSTNLFPAMAFLQVSPGIESPVLPYFGVGGGYELLFLSADDFSTGEEFDATYGGWGWQVWGGLAFPLSGQSKLAAEVFLNNAELERDVEDPAGTFREIVDVDGVGMRFGLSWGF